MSVMLLYGSKMLACLGLSLSHARHALGALRVRRAYCIVDMKTWPLAGLDLGNVARRRYQPLNHIDKDHRAMFWSYVEMFNC